MNKLITTTLTVIGFVVIGLVSCTVAADDKQAKIDEKIRQINKVYEDLGVDFHIDELSDSAIEELMNPQPEKPSKGMIEGLYDDELYDLNVMCEIARVFMDLPSNPELWAIDEKFAYGIAQLVSGIVEGVTKPRLESGMIACRSVEDSIKYNARS